MAETRTLFCLLKRVSLQPVSDVATQLPFPRKELHYADDGKGDRETIEIDDAWSWCWCEAPHPNARF